MLQPPPEKYHRSPLKTAGTIFLLVVMGLFGLLLVSALRGSRLSARRAQCLSNLKQLGLAMHMYSEDYDERFPTVGAPRAEGGVASLQLLYAKYVSDPDLFVCPCDEAVTPWDGKDRFDASHCSYGYDHNHTSTDPADVALVSDYTGFEDSPYDLPMCHYRGPFVSMGLGLGGPVGVDGMHVLFVDGHVKWCITRDVGHYPGGAAKRDDIYTKSETLPPAEDSWITQ